MQTTYAQKNNTLQKASANTAESIVDSSSQSATLQRHASLANAAAQRAPEPRPNLTGMPDNLKSGIESLSGYSMDDVRVHYNSDKPATVQALAYTQGTDIHVAPGQEHALPHEAWHVAQQMAGRVSPTTNINGLPVNDNAALEHEADVMGEKAVQCKMPENGWSDNSGHISFCKNSTPVQFALSVKQRDYVNRFFIDEKYLKDHVSANASKKMRQDTFDRRKEKGIKKSTTIVGVANQGNYESVNLKETLEKKALGECKFGGNAYAERNEQYGTQIHVFLSGIKSITTSEKGEENSSKGVGIVGKWEQRGEDKFVQGHHFESFDELKNMKNDEQVFPEITNKTESKTPNKKKKGTKK